MSDAMSETPEPISDEALAEFRRFLNDANPRHNRTIYALALRLLEEVDRLRAPAQLGSALVDALAIEPGGALIIDLLHGAGYEVEYAESGACGPSTTDASRRLAAMLCELQEASRLAAFPQEDSR